MMFKNTASQKLTVFAFADAGHATLDAGEPVTGDAANITCKVEQDDDGTQSATNDVNPTEVEDGQYRFDLTQAETNGDKLTFYPQSATAGVQVVALPSKVIYTTPAKVDANVIELNGVASAAVNLGLSAGTIVQGTVDTATNGHTPTTTEFQADDITEATADHFNGRLVVFTSGALVNQFARIEDYVAVGGIGQFTVSAMTEAPANNDTFLIV